MLFGTRSRACGFVGRQQLRSDLEGEASWGYASTPRQRALLTVLQIEIAFKAMRGCGRDLTGGLLSKMYAPRSQNV